MNLLPHSERNSDVMHAHLMHIYSFCWSRLFFSIFIVLYLSLYSSVIFAEKAITDTNNSANKIKPLCATDETTNKYLLPRAFPEETNENTEISADFTQTGKDGVTLLGGNVVIERNFLRVIADRAQYDTNQEILEVSGNIHISTKNLSLNANSGSINIDETNKQSNFTDITFSLPSRNLNDHNMKGSAALITTSEHQDKNYSLLKNASITSCDLFDPDWIINANKIQLNHDDQYGSASGMTLRFKKIPLLYLPYIEFPTSTKRRSGFLFPEIGTSTSKGLELAAPWYWNIAPNHDAILTPRILEKRGLELDGQYRFLTESTNGELNIAFLNKDSITRERRYRIRYQQHTKILPNLLFDANLQSISDTNFFNDFTSSINSTSQTHLYKNATLNYSLNNWHMRALVQDIETIDTTTAISERPYERLPQLTLTGDTEINNGPFLFIFDSEFVNFRHEDKNQIAGSRLTVRPGIRLPLSGTAWFFNPAIKLSHTQYDISTASGLNENIGNRNLIMSSIDTGLFLEKNLDNGYQQTLESRLYYLNVPFEEQNNTPIFDTSIPEFSVAQLFRDNRFIGGDRIGDANQLTLSLTSRILNTNTGNEFLRASIGQIFYFDDRKVSLDGSIDEEKQSDIIAELDTRWQHWKSNIDLQWDTDNNKFAKENYFLHYKSDAKHLFNIGYRKRLVNNILDIEQTDISFVYAINQRYTTFARWNYSLIDNRGIHSILGLAYDNCCWSLQIFTQRRLQNSNTAADEFDNSILIQFVLKGLGSLSGSTARTTLKQSIHGYTDSFK